MSAASSVTSAANTRAKQPLSQLFVAELEGVLQIQQADHQTDGQAAPACGGDAKTEHLHGWAEQLVLCNGPICLAGQTWGNAASI